MMGVIINSEPKIVALWRPSRRNKRSEGTEYSMVLNQLKQKFNHHEVGKNNVLI